MENLTIAVISGTIIASLTYLIKQSLDFWFFNPWTEYQQIRGKTLESAIFLSHFLERLPSNKQEDTKLEIIKIWINENQNLRRLAGSMIAFRKKKHRLLFGIPSKSELSSVASNLLGLASCTRESDLAKAKEYTSALVKKLGADI